MHMKLGISIWRRLLLFELGNCIFGACQSGKPLCLKIKLLLVPKSRSSSTTLRICLLQVVFIFSGRQQVVNPKDQCIATELPIECATHALKRSTDKMPSSCCPKVSISKCCTHSRLRKVRLPDTRLPTEATLEAARPPSALTAEIGTSSDLSHCSCFTMLSVLSAGSTGFEALGVVTV